MRLLVRVPGLLQIHLVAAVGFCGLACGGSSPSGGGGGASGTPGTTSGTTTGETSEAATTTSTTDGTTTGTTTGGGAGGSTSSGGQGGSGGAQSSGGASTDGSAGSGGGSGGSSEVDCNTGTLTTRLPCQLSETGLFAEDMVTLGEGVHPYTPEFKLWSDSAEKRRWVWLPPDTQIDTSDIDYWSFPVGTKLWKEFTRDGTRVETRLIEKQMSGTWYTVAYLWREDQTEADAIPDGMMNASGTEHDVPNSDQCWTCHSQQPDKALGFSAIQLSHDPEDANNPDEWTLDRLVAADLLTDPPTLPLEFSSSWSDLDRAMFGYMHSNCGVCHNPRGSANGTTGLDLLLRVNELAGTAEESTPYVGIVDVDIMKQDVMLDATKRIDPGSLENSAIYQRVVTKGQEWSMPPLGTELVDTTAQQLLEDFIMGLQ